MTVLTLVAFMTILFAGLAFYINYTFITEKRSNDEFQVKKLLREKLEAVYNMILENKENEADSTFDEYWQFVEAQDDVTLTDLSSRLNPNWIERALLEHLNTVLVEPPDSLFTNTQEYGIEEFLSFQDKGPYADIKRSYGNFFSAEVIDKYFTEYNYYNINVAYQFVDRALYNLRTGSETEGTNFEGKIQAYFAALDPKLNQGKSSPMVKSSGELFNWFISNGFGQEGYDQMFPLFNAEPVMNIHFVPEELLYGIMSFPAYNYPDAKDRAEKAVAERENAEYNQGTLGEIFGYGELKYPQNKVYQYFGLITWFWEIKAVEDNAEMTWVIARVPPKAHNPGEVEYKLLKEEFIVHPRQESEEDAAAEELPEEGELPGEFPAEEFPEEYTDYEG